MIEDRVDRFARRLARSEPQLYITKTGATPPAESVFDGVARALVAPVTRRRAVGLIGGAVLAGSLLRPRRARAAACGSVRPTATYPNCCSRMGAAADDFKCCVQANLQCCSNDRCALACPYSYRDCVSPARCDDTPRMCQPANHEEAGVRDANRTKFCSMELSVPNGCVDTGFGPAIRGWCCRPNEDCYTFRSTSDVDFGTCQCPDDPEGRGERNCNDTCCAKGQICVDDRSGLGKHCKTACVKGRHYNEEAQCVCDSGDTCRNGCCPEGKVCDKPSGRCVAPTDPSGFFKNLTKNFGDFSGSDTGNQAAGSRAGGSNYFRLGHVAAGPGATPVRSALLLLAAVNARGAAAAIAFTDFHVDRAYRRRVVAARPRLPKLAGTPGFDPGAARALDALLAAEAKAFAQIAAAATALARSRGALRAHNPALARKQALAAANFASAAASALRGVPVLRRRAAAALRAAGVAEVNAGVIDVAALQAEVKASGIPANLTGLLKGLGIIGDDLKRVRQAFAAITPSGGPALIDPLSDPARNRTITRLAGELAKYARSARRSPIRRSRVQPLRVRPPRR